MRPLACIAAALAAALTFALPVNHALAGVLTDSAVTAVYLAPGKAVSALGVSLPGTGDGSLAVPLAVLGVALFAVAAAVGLKGKRSPMRSSLALAVAVLGVAATLSVGTSLAFAGGENGVFTATSEITATYDADGNVTVPDVELKNETGSAVVLEGAKVVSDYGFVSGWTNDAAGKTVEPGKALTIKWTANSKLPADWKRGSKVRVGTVAYSYVVEDADKDGADDKADGKTNKTDGKTDGADDKSDDKDDDADDSAKAIDFSKVGLDATKFTYDGKAKTPAVTGLDDLTEGTDYKVEYEDNVDAGTATATVTGIGNYTGSKTLEFTIEPQAVDTAALKLAEGENVYDGKAHEPAVEGIPEDLDQGTDYDVTYFDNVNAGTATATVKFKGNYTGSKTLEFAINPRRLTQAELDNIDLDADGLVYGADEKKPEVTGVPAGLKQDTDYVISYKNNVNATTDKSKATATVTFKGNYSGSKTLGFVISPKTVSVTWDPEGDAGYAYDGDAHAPVATIEGAEGSDALLPLLSYKKGSEPLKSAPSDPGTYTVTVEGFSSKGDAASNYALPTDGLSKDFTIKLELGAFWFASANAENPESAAEVPKGIDGAYKTEAKIKADVVKIQNEIASGTTENSGSTFQEYKMLMNNDAFHLYTKWNGVAGKNGESTAAVTTGKNAYVEFRIIQVGPHDDGGNLGSDGSAVTFAATHSLPTAQQMNSEWTNAGGWASSAMRNTVFGDNGYVQTGLSDLKDAAIEVKKAAVSDSSGEWKVSAASDKFWLLSVSEVFGAASDGNPFISGTLDGTVYFHDEGSQYAWFRNKSVNAKNGWTAKNSDIADMRKVRSGSIPAGSNHGAYWWLRSPGVSGSNGFCLVFSSGDPSSDLANFACGVVPAFSM